MCPIYYEVLISESEEILYYICFTLIQNAKLETTAIVAQLQGAESEVNALRTMTHRMILTQKEMVCIHVFAHSTHKLIAWFK